MLGHSLMSSFVQPHGLEPSRLLCPWNSSGKNTGVGCHFLLQGIFPTQGSNLQLMYPASAGGLTTSTNPFDNNFVNVFWKKIFLI